MKKKYVYEVEIIAESEKKANKIMKNIKGINKYDFLYSNFLAKDYIDGRLKILEEFAKTKSGIAVDKFMKKWNDKIIILTPEQKVQFWMDVIKVNEIIKEENQNIEIDSDGYFYMDYIHPVINEERRWTFAEYSMAKSLEAAMEL